MTNQSHRSYPVTDRSYEASVKREVRLLATQAGFSTKKLNEIDIIVAELTSNLVKYATDGELLARPIRHGTNTGLELISLDSGPGMANPDRMLIDGVSTGGSLGQGLGAIGRLADLFQLYSLPGRGTVGLVRVFQTPISPSVKPPLALVQAVAVPKPGEAACGDGFYCRLTSESLTVFLGDGLGHGPLAQKAVQQAVRALRQWQDDSPASWLAAIHEATLGTRGLVGTGAIFDFSTRKWSICGVGNIRTQLVGTSQKKNYMAQNGILGYNVPKTLLNQELTYEPGQCLIMASDGIQTHWSPARYPDVSRYDPVILAAAIYKEHARRTDDMSVLVARIF